MLRSTLFVLNKVKNYLLNMKEKTDSVLLWQDHINLEKSSLTFPLSSNSHKIKRMVCELTLRGLCLRRMLIINCINTEKVTSHKTIICK